MTKGIFEMIVVNGLGLKSLRIRAACKYLFRVHVQKQSSAFRSWVMMCLKGHFCICAVSAAVEVEKVYGSCCDRRSACLTSSEPPLLYMQYLWKHSPCRFRLELLGLHYQDQRTRRNRHRPFVFKSEKRIAASQEDFELNTFH